MPTPNVAVIASFELPALEHELVVGRVYFRLRDTDVRHGHCWAAVVQHLADQLDGCPAVVHQPAPCLPHRVRTQLKLHLIPYGLEGIGDGHAADWLILGSVAVYLEQVRVSRVGCPTTLYDGLGSRVQLDVAGLAGLAFLDDQIAALYVLERQAQQVADTKGCVDAESPDVSVQGIAPSISGQSATNFFGFALALDRFDDVHFLFTFHRIPQIVLIRTWGFTASPVFSVVG